MAIGIKNKVEDFKASLGRLSSRERFALGGLGTAILLAVTLVVGYVIYSGLEELEVHNASMRQALNDLNRYGKDFMVQRRRVAALEVRMARTPLELNSFVEQAAKAVGVEISESDVVQPVDVDHYTQRGLEVKLRKVNLEQLSKLLKELENSAQIVQITRLSVSTRWNEHQELNVELVVSTYERRKEKPRPAEDKEPGGSKNRRGRERS